VLLDDSPVLLPPLLLDVSPVLVLVPLLVSVASPVLVLLLPSPVLVLVSGSPMLVIGSIPPVVVGIMPVVVGSPVVEPLEELPLELSEVTSDTKLVVVSPAHAGESTSTRGNERRIGFSCDRRGRTIGRSGSERLTGALFRRRRGRLRPTSPHRVGPLPSASTQRQRAMLAAARSSSKL
jgi:hypothetical protein